MPYTKFKGIRKELGTAYKFDPEKKVIKKKVSVYVSNTSYIASHYACNGVSIIKAFNDHAEEVNFYLNTRISYTRSLSSNPPR